MSHYPKPFYRAPRKLWYVQLDGKQINLGRDEAEAHRRYHELMANRDTKPPEPEPVSDLVVAVLDAFLDWVQVNRAPKSYNWYRIHLETFAASIPRTLTVSQLKAFHVTTVCDAHPRWKPNTRHGFCRAVQRVFRWAERQGRIARSPLAHVEKPTPESKDVVVSPDEYRAVMALVARQPRFRDLLEMAWESGARPQELRLIEAKHVDFEHGRIVFPPREAKGKKVTRVVYMTPEAAAIVRRLVAEHPTGAVFRNSEGAAWTKDAINCAFCRLQKKHGRKLHLGAFRKSWATEALKNGVDPVTAAHLMGHRDTSMISRIYARVQQDPEHMQNAAKKAKGLKASGDASIAPGS